MRTYTDIERMKIDVKAVEKELEQYIDSMIDNYFDKSMTGTFTITIADGYGSRDYVMRNDNFLTQTMDKYELSEAGLKGIMEPLVKKYQCWGVNLQYYFGDVGYGEDSYILAFSPDKFEKKDY